MSVVADPDPELEGGPPVSRRTARHARAFATAADARAHLTTISTPTEPTPDLADQIIDAARDAAISALIDVHYATRDAEALLRTDTATTAQRDVAVRAVRISLNTAARAIGRLAGLARR